MTKTEEGLLDNNIVLYIIYIETLELEFYWSLKFFQEEFRVYKKGFI